MSITFESATRTRRRMPLDMPAPAARTVLQAAAKSLHDMSKATGCFATRALADALDEMSAGNDAAAWQAMQEAAAYRAMRA